MSTSKVEVDPMRLFNHRLGGDEHPLSNNSELKSDDLNLLLAYQDVLTL
ncbi:hypothetical protein [Paraglaciecola chathamensis]|nr:hypothetical protein [Paraglaciecola chathamensis]MDO6559768.1 hypothetical protein [Paraglaciecola chathamensis]